MYHFSLTLSCLFLVVVSLPTLFAKLPIIIIATYLGLSAATFLMYWKDKKAATEDCQRTPENTLHILAVLGGWPGALIGQQKLRHKTKKVSFRIVLWSTIFINLAMLLALLFGLGFLPFLSK